jgi:RND family efflux transporter MFP subunit
MKKRYLFITAIAFLTACSQGGSDVETKKKELEEAKKEYQALKSKIDELEKELVSMDPEYAKEVNKAILVSVFKPEQRPFEHKIEVRGAVQSRRNVLISSQISGSIERVHVREGQQVNKGQVLVELDADVIRNSITELKTSLELANAIYEKQAKLWEQKIGTEVQYLQAKNNKESLESRLATAYSQLDQAIIRAPFSGNIDNVPAREGELAAPGVPLVRITSKQDMYINADVSERYIGKFSVGDKAEVYFPVLDKHMELEISAVSQVINPENRTFNVEITIPKTDLTLKPNQVAVLKLRDYYAKGAFAVPTKLIQVDTQGQYIYEVKKEGEKQIARKLYVKTGATYDGSTEVVEGITGAETLVSEGFRDLSNNVEVAVASASAQDSSLAKTIK